MVSSIDGLPIMDTQVQDGLDQLVPGEQDVSLGSLRKLLDANGNGTLGEDQDYIRYNRRVSKGPGPKSTPIAKGTFQHVATYVAGLVAKPEVAIVTPENAESVKYAVRVEFADRVDEFDNPNAVQVYVDAGVPVQRLADASDGSKRYLAIHGPKLYSVSVHSDKDSDQTTLALHAPNPFEPKRGAVRTVTIPSTDLWSHGFSKDLPVASEALRDYLWDFVTQAGDFRIK